jgi:hypothetical protein
MMNRFDQTTVPDDLLRKFLIIASAPGVGSL